MRRQTPHSLPGNFFAFLSIVFEFFYLCAFRISRMTRQTQCRGRPSRDDILLRALMAAGARKVELDMSLVRKRDRLLDIRVHPS